MSNLVCGRIYAGYEDIPFGYCRIEQAERLIKEQCEKYAQKIVKVVMRDETEMVEDPDMYYSTYYFVDGEEVSKFMSEEVYQYAKNHPDDLWVYKLEDNPYVCTEVHTQTALDVLKTYGDSYDGSIEINFGTKEKPAILPKDFPNAYCIVWSDQENDETRYVVADKEVGSYSFHDNTVAVLTKDINSDILLDTNATAMMIGDISYLHIKTLTEMDEKKEVLPTIVATNIDWDVDTAAIAEDIVKNNKAEEMLSFYDIYDPKPYIEYALTQDYGSDWDKFTYKREYDEKIKDLIKGVLDNKSYEDLNKFYIDCYYPKKFVVPYNILEDEDKIYEYAGIISTLGNKPIDIQTYECSMTPDEIKGRIDAMDRDEYPNTHKEIYENTLALITDHKESDMDR